MVDEVGNAAGKVMTWETLCGGNALVSGMMQASEKYGKNKGYRGVGYFFIKLY